MMPLLKRLMFRFGCAVIFCSFYNFYCGSFFLSFFLSYKFDISQHDSQADSTQIIFNPRAHPHALWELIVKQRLGMRSCGMPRKGNTTQSVMPCFGVKDHSGKKSFEHFLLRGGPSDASLKIGIM